jgi:hypothetical protein
MVPANFAGTFSMTTYRAKLWTSVGAALVIGAGGLAACTDRHPEPGAGVKAGADAHGEATGHATAAVGEAGETAAGEGGGEAGVSDAYAGIPAESRTALRIAHLKGFFLAAEKMSATNPEEAAVLAGQGMLEVFDPKADLYRQAGVDEKLLRAAAEKGDRASLQAAISTLDQAAKRVGGKPADVVKGMVEIAAGLYSNVVTADGVDPVEYQHSYGAALSAQAAADQHASDPAIQAAKADLGAFLALWPAPVAPEDAAKATPVGKVKAQASRIELGLAG